MPLYEYECEICGRISERVFSVEHFPSIVACDRCDGRSRKIISQIQDVKPAWEPYYDGNLEAMITSRRQRRELMRAQGLEEKPRDATKERIIMQEREHNKQEEIKNAK